MFHGGVGKKVTLVNPFPILNLRHADTKLTELDESRL